MSDEPKLAMWMGKRVDEMTREELVEALNIMANHERRQSESHMRALETVGKFRRSPRRWF